jgi:hypothetical protein
MLSFGYSLLARDASAALARVGLDPMLGFFHTMIPGRPALALCFGGVLAGCAWVAQFLRVHAFGVPTEWFQPMTVLLLAVFLFSIGVQLLLMGLLGEVLIRTYHESQGKKTYLVGELLNFAERAKA